jgi:predicted pyridoxine 5'-phosphate oxidase superfamily flavin-nucleotide-binding protein
MEETLSHPFHAGEVEAQHRAGFGTNAGAPIRDWMPDQHRLFFAGLPFLLAAGVDAGGFPVATVLEGPPGFVRSPDARTLAIAVAPAPGDPAAPALGSGAPIGLLGIDLSTRRRNRANGTVLRASPDGLLVRVRQSFGNCPQYIQGREPFWSPEPASDAPAEAGTRLDGEARRQIERADTFFVATATEAPDAARGGVDISHRGGRPGFVRIEGNTLTIPDFRGNRYFNTFGNLVDNPRAGLLFVEFETGDVLGLQGRADIQWDPATVGDLAGAERFWSVTVDRMWRRRRALRLRWAFRDFSRTTAATGILREGSIGAQ